MSVFGCVFWFGWGGGVLIELDMDFVFDRRF